jgi:hypothetical protein
MNFKTILKKISFLFFSERYLPTVIKITKNPIRFCRRIQVYLSLLTLSYHLGNNIFNSRLFKLCENAIKIDNKQVYIYNFYINLLNAINGYRTDKFDKHIDFVLGKKIYSQKILIFIAKRYCLTNKAEVTNILKLFVKLYGFNKNISGNLIFAEYLHVFTNYIGEDEIDKRVKLKNSVKLLDDDLINNIFSNKSIAIVGNANTQLNKETGQEIDNHDYVVRFNNYVISKEYASDYGKKENVFCLVANDNVEYREYFEKYKYIILSQNIYNRVLSDKVVDNLHLYSKSGKLYFIDEKNSEIYKDKYRVLDFSAGLRLLFGLLKTNYHLFGFHYTSKSTFNWNKRHYFQIYNNITYQILHRWDVEKKIIGEILENK